MSLFQKSVLKKHLKLQEKEIVEKAYKKYTKYFLNPTIQENIRSSKEEEYQGIFLTELFVTILDYTLKPNADFNLVAEYKNQTNARKADGAILNDNIAIAVIELKGTKTKDLESIRKQAFDYKANQKGCVYVITSNFEKLRFYINDATEFEEFNLFELTKEQFQFLYLCLHKDNIINNIPLKIKEASVVKEEQITKEFYNDYSLFKRELYRDLIKQNLKNPVFRTEQEKENIDSINKNIKLSLFKKSQKLIDRFLFIFFAEDRGLLPPNSTLQILENWDKLKDLDVEVPLYNRFKLYFKYLDTGREGTDKKAEIFAYNGGLFKPDAVLDSLILDDTLLYKHTKKLSEYDFDSQVDVNILGHIFENSLNEIESVNAEIQGSNFDKQTSKRKKDGVFYTPKYITKYIVDNTVGKLCTEKKIELGIKEDDYFKGRKNRNKTTIIKLVSFLDVYREWLLKLTICDPACGSGAFLNQALDFLIKEHTYIDELKTKLLGGGFVFPDIENKILENNIFGVDLNEESVEIAKLSLWLRTAQPRRKLNNLNSNIKCGNSLIDSKTVAGDKAFKWENEFPQIFENGGFDVIIGNPPYVRQELFKEIKPYLEKNYKCYNSVADLYTYFIEKGINLMNEKGLFSFILPNKFLKATYGKNIRKVMKEDANLELLLDFDDYPVFADATTYPIIYILNKKSDNKAKTFLYSEINKRDNTDDPIITLENKKHLVSFASLTQDSWNFIDSSNQFVLNKIKENSIQLSLLVDGKINRGILTGKNDVFIFDKKKKNEILKSDENKSIIKPILLGSSIKRYNINYENNYIIFSRRGIDIEEYPLIKDYLMPFYEELKPRNNGETRGRKAGTYKWYEIQDNVAYYKDFEEPKIVYPRTNNNCNFQLDNDGFYLSDNNFYIKSGSKELLGVLNSKLIYFYLKNICTTLQGGYYDFRRDKVDTIPIKINFENIGLDKIVSLTMEFYFKNSKLIHSFQNYLKQKFQLEKLSKKLQNWHDLEFGDFIKELNKAIKSNNKELVKNELPIIPVLTKLDEMDWMDVFTVKKSEAQALKTQINQTDTEIDAMVYKLYNLTDAEIAIVENS
ncbi:Eco57I restriction-modification methylase domain-containing protein [Tenacibaculum piscium]|uniref:Eco57I restriction-modification methylase domain-containing protein n=1 Tax=Tenacibaculum piscium TaxID=1458515 RepID=UPI001EFC1BAB|nr:TaqI-like C-terminal specificity domain-containing protein [Tenacibaculum piscium]MCG8182683.1 Eco57I restriction-modification methylase domain-containing protein [Tenacibaculum piscium]MCG8204075.1 Eco57I restriction-modification methylase domain-containing protein [Tenacibaculum piscium]